jgi:glycosyltransferase involved in cell wall biosynthesis
VSEPRVTVGIPTYNRASLLRDCLESVLSQTVADIEVYVSDNASTDQTAATVEGFDDPRVHYAPLERNIGLHANLTRCLQLGSAPFIAMLPDDEVLFPYSLARKLAILAEHPEVGFVHSALLLRQLGPNDEPLGETVSSTEGDGVIAPGAAVVRRQLTGSYYIHASTVFARRAIVADIPFALVDAPASDLGFCLRLSQRSREVAYIAEPLSASLVHASADSIKKSYEFVSGSWQTTFSALRNSTKVQERFLEEYAREIPDARALRVAVRRRGRRSTAHLLSQRSRASVGVTSRLRLLVQAARANPTVLMTRTAARHLVVTFSGEYGLRAGRRISRALRAGTVRSSKRRLMAPTKLLFVSHSAVIAGAEMSLYELVKGLREAGGVTLGVVFPERGPLLSRIDALGVRTWVLGYSRWATPRVHLRTKLASVARNAVEVIRFLRLFLVTRPDVVVTNTVTVPSAAFAARLARVPHVWYAHEYGVEEHGLVFRLGRSRSLRLVGRLSTIVVVPSRFLMREFEPYVPANGLRLIQLAPETPSPGGRSEPAATRPLRLVVLGYKAPGKGQEDAIRAIGLLRGDGVDATLSLVGSGRARYVTHLRKLASDLGVADVVQFVEFTEDRWSWFEESDALLMCSRLETASRVIIEAVKLGCPVIAARSGAAPEQIVDGETGLLYAPGDAADLASKIRLLHDDRALAGTLARNAKRRANGRFTTGRYSSDFLEIAQEALALSVAGAGGMRRMRRRERREDRSITVERPGTLRIGR